MDPVSITASLLTLIEATTVVGKAAIKVCREMRDAPQELERIASRILETRSRLDLQLRMHSDQLVDLIHRGDELTGLADFSSFKLSLDSAKRCLNTIEEAMGPQGDKASKIRSLRWMLREKRPVRMLLQHLGEIEDDLSRALTVISLSISLASYSSIKGMARQQASLCERMQQTSLVEHSAQPRVQEERAHDDGDAHNYLASSPSTSVENRQQVGKPRIRTRHGATEQISSIRSFLLINAQWNLLRSTCVIRSLLKIPFSSNHLIAIRATLERFRLSWPTMTYSITLRNIVSMDSSFMVACAAGDIIKARDLALARQGGPTDIDENGVPALHKAITSNELELVRFLLDNGADPNELETRYLRSALQLTCRLGYIDIARLLLARGATVEHVDASGCTALIMLWFDTNIPFSRAEFARALHAASPLSLNSDAEELFEPLACVAMKGSAEDVKLMLGLGAKIPEPGATSNRIMNCCIGGSNPEAYDCLVPHMSLDWIHQEDSRGRNKLHLALNTPGRHTKDIVKRLLKAGADVHARDDEGKRPEDVAKETDRRTRGIEIWKVDKCQNFQAYVEALSSCGFDVIVDEGELFWPA